MGIDSIFNLRKKNLKKKNYSREVKYLTARCSRLNSLNSISPPRYAVIVCVLPAFIIGAKPFPGVCFNSNF